jgi:hypothetical protein
MDYMQFITKKSQVAQSFGFAAAGLNESLKPHQKAIVEWACKRGKAAIFADTGLGKTFMQLEWGRLVARHTNKPVLLLAPLAVGKQTESEAYKFKIDAYCEYIREPSKDVDIQITNYEMLDRFNPNDFGGIILDESSILKGKSGAYRKMITEFAINIPYRLSCTATPSPNDYMELGTQAEFLGIMSQVEMLSTFFIHDGSETQKWRLKGHGVQKFWEWMATWSVMISSPADLGFDGADYDLPPLIIEEEILPSMDDTTLFATVASGLNEARKAKRRSLESRVKAAADWVNSLDEPCIVWGELNDETDLAANLIDGAVNVRGSDKQEKKEANLIGFTNGEFEKLVSKSSICGFGMNWFHSSKMAFVGPTYSFEQFYQAVRRQWRFGQTKPVTVKVFMTEEEAGIHATMIRKMEQDKNMRKEMIKVMKSAMQKEIFGATQDKATYNPESEFTIPSFL